MRDFKVYCSILNWKVKFEPSFDRAVMMGLMLHANAKQMIKKENYKDALEVLSMGEVSHCHWCIWCYWQLWINGLQDKSNDRNGFFLCCNKGIRINLIFPCDFEIWVSTFRLFTIYKGFPRGCSYMWTTLSSGGFTMDLSNSTVCFITLLFERSMKKW